MRRRRPLLPFRGLCGKGEAWGAAESPCPEREWRWGLAGVTNETPAVNAGRKKRAPHKNEVREWGAAACRLGSVDKKIPAINAGGKAKEKAEPGRPIASRLRPTKEK